MHIKASGVRQNLIRAEFATEDDDTVRILARADGTNLLADYRRASNIERIEEEKDGMGSEFYVLLAIVTVLTLGSGVGAVVIAKMGRLTEPQKKLLDALIWIMVGCASALLMMLGAHLRLG